MNFQYQPNVDFLCSVDEGTHIQSIKTVQHLTTKKWQTRSQWLAMRSSDTKMDRLWWNITTHVWESCQSNSWQPLSDHLCLPSTIHWHCRCSWIAVCRYGGTGRDWSAPDCGVQPEIVAYQAHQAPPPRSKMPNDCMVCSVLNFVAATGFKVQY